LVYQLPSRMSLREILIASLLILIVAVLFLIQPKVPPGLEEYYCVRPVNLWGPVHFNLHCDSYRFIVLAQDPHGLLELDNKRQGRPLYILLGWALAIPFRALPSEFTEQYLPNVNFMGLSPEHYLPEFSGFLLLNGLLLLASILLFRRLLGSTSLLNAWTLLPLVVLLANEVTKAFFWVPHLQIFNIFVPIASLSLYCWMQPRLQTLTWLHFSVVGLLVGFGALIYGSFAVTAVGAALCILVGEGTNALRERLASKSLQSFLLLGSFFLPTAAWVGLVTSLTGSFYNHEIVKFRQFVWLGDSLAQGANVLFADLAANFVEYTHTVATVLAFPCLALASVVAITLALNVSHRPDDLYKSRGFAVLLYFLSALLFYGLMGFYQTRLSWALVPAVLLILGMEIRQLEPALVGVARFAVKASLVIVSVAYLAYWVFTAGPYN
jgi:hypothetical protein